MKFSHRVLIFYEKNNTPNSDNYFTKNVQFFKVNLGVTIESHPNGLLGQKKNGSEQQEFKTVN